MESPAPSTSLVKSASPTDLFTPKLVTVLREGYRLDDLRADVLAGPAVDGLLKVGAGLAWF